MNTRGQRLPHPLFKYSQPPEVPKPDALLGSCHHVSYGLHLQSRKAVLFIQQPHTYNCRTLSGCSVSGDFEEMVVPCGPVMPVTRWLHVPQHPFQKVPPLAVPSLTRRRLGFGTQEVTASDTPGVSGLGRSSPNVAILSTGRENSRLGSLLTNSNCQDSLWCADFARHFTWFFSLNLQRVLQDGD